MALFKLTKNAKLSKKDTVSILTGASILTECPRIKLGLINLHKVKFTLNSGEYSKSYNFNIF